MNPMRAKDETQHSTLPADRYEPVRAALPEVLPAITRQEAEKAQRRLYRRFGKLEDGRKVRPYQVRRCWISPRPIYGNDKGWGRLIHDVSHHIFERVYPSRRPHDPLHAHYEAEIARYVATAGWLDGTLKPRPKAKPTLIQKRLAELVKVEAALKRWTTKANRAATAIKKLRRKHKRLQQEGAQAPSLILSYVH
jgi:hypothetical protein